MQCISSLFNYVTFRMFLAAASGLHVFSVGIHFVDKERMIFIDRFLYLVTPGYL